MTRPCRGRRPGDSGTKEHIRAEARRQFGARGYRATTLRSVASGAGVDARLVLHYFGSKEELFKASVELPLDPELVVQRAFRDGVDGIGVNVAALLFEVLEDPRRRQPMLAILRATLAEPEATPLIREVLLDQLLRPIARRVGGDEPELRAGLVASQVVGVEVVRYVVGLPQMAEVSPERLAAILAPVIQHYFTDPLPRAETVRDGR